MCGEFTQKRSLEESALHSFIQVEIPSLSISSEEGTKTCSPVDHAAVPLLANSAQTAALPLRLCAVRAAMPKPRPTLPSVPIAALPWATRHSIDAGQHLLRLNSRIMPANI